MAPSRGHQHTTPHSSAHTHDEAAISQQSSSALINARRNFSYLVNPSSSAQPTRFRTRAFLRSVRFLGQFIFWRLVRWAKYAAVGAIVAAVGATAFGTFISGVGWVLAPPSFGAAIITASVWGTGKFIARRAHLRWKRSGGDKGEEVRERARDFSEEDVNRRAGRGLGTEAGPAAVPW